MAFGTFLKCLMVFVFFNFITFLLGLTPMLFLSPITLIATFGIIAGVLIVTSLIPLINGGSSQLTWIGKTILMVSILFSINIPFFGSVGFGLCSNLMLLGTPDIHSVFALPYYGFLVLGLLALTSVFMGSGGGD